MVEEKATAGRRALRAWLNRCKAEKLVILGYIGMFKKLISALVDSTILYGVEIWGCMRSLETIEQVQLRAFCMFFWVDTLHSKASLTMEMESLPVVWESRVRCVQFCYKVLTSKVHEGRLLRKVASQAVECEKGSWMISIGRCVGKFGRQDVSGGAIRELSEADVTGMLLSVACRNMRDEWREVMHEKPKLSMMKWITESRVKSSCAFLKSKAERRVVLKLRGGTAAFQIEMKWWHGLKREEQVCKECDSEEIEVVCHWLLQCSAWYSLQTTSLEAMNGVGEDFSTKGNGSRTALILSYACRNHHILSVINSMWSARF